MVGGFFVAQIPYMHNLNDGLVNNSANWDQNQAKFDKGYFSFFLFRLASTAIPIGTWPIPDSDKKLGYIGISMPE